jgi:hypothetical protein
MKPRTIVLGLGLALAAGLVLSHDHDHGREPAYEIRMEGSLLAPHGRRRSGSSNDTWISNPSNRTRRLTITWRAPSCRTSDVSISITNHYGKPIYAGKAPCEPIVVPIAAVQHVKVNLHGRGSYDLVLALE